VFAILACAGRLRQLGRGAGHLLDFDAASEQVLASEHKTLALGHPFLCGRQRDGGGRLDCDARSLRALACPSRYRLRARPTSLDHGHCALTNSIARNSSSMAQATADPRAHGLVALSNIIIPFHKIEY